MMLADMFTLQQVLRSFETTLFLEYEERDVPSILKAAQQRLENAYQCRLDQPVYAALMQNEFVGTELTVFLEKVAECVKQLAALNSVALFTKKPPVNLADVNYLGFTAETVRTGLAYLQDRILYEKRVDAISDFTRALSNLEMSQIKRLFIIMLMLERLGISEGVAACAQLLYIGGLTL